MLLAPDHRRVAGMELERPDPRSYRALRHSLTVSVVVPASRDSKRLERCLKALSAQSRQPEEVVVATADTAGAEAAAAQRPGTRMVPVRGVFSFCRMVNGGIAATDGEWVLLLNDDVVLEPTFLERLLGGISNDDERIGMVCGKLLAEDGRTIDSTGQFLSRARTAAERGYRSPDDGRFDQPGAVFSVPGAAALYRRRMLEDLARARPVRQGRVQYFDERLGTYLEDLELGWRAQRAGWRAYYVPQARAVHRRGATAKGRRPRWPWLRRYYLPWLSPKYQARYILNRYRLIAAHDTPWSLLRDGVWILAYELRLWAYLVCVERRTLRLLLRVLRRSVRSSAV